MSDVVIASSEPDAQAAAAVERHHAELAGALAARVEALLAAARSGDTVAGSAAKAELVAWCGRELVPHALAEETALYPAARVEPTARPLVDGMLGEHRVLSDLVRRIADAEHLVSAVAAAGALRVMFDSHQAKENELLMPLLVAAPNVSVAALLAGMREAMAAAADEPDSSAARCGCGETDGAGDPELDAQAIPHAIRHATIFGALDAVRPGAGLVLVATHDPVPLLRQLESRSPGTFTVEYLRRGPEEWRLRFSRPSATG